MKKLLYVIAIFAVIAGGFVLGRLTGSSGANAPVLKVANREFPLFPAPPKSDGSYEPAPTVPDKDVIVESPLDGERPRDAAFEVSGRAKADGKPLSVSVTDEGGATLFTGIVTPDAAGSEPYGRFSVHVTLDPMPTAPVTLRVAREGQTEGADVRKLAFGGNDSVAVNVYFSNQGADGESCGQVYAVQRMVPVNVAIYRASIEELLKGPNADDIAENHLTSIPGSVTLKSIGADAAGTVTADFTQQLTRGISDSCRLETIRAQIAATLKQFPEVRDVTITVAGEADVFGTTKDN